MNNRDLHTFNVDPTRTSSLASMVPSNVILVALSGISSRKDVEPYVAAGARVSIHMYIDIIVSSLRPDTIRLF